MSSESSVGSGLEGGGADVVVGAPLGSDGRESDLSEVSGVGGLLAPVEAAAPLMAGSWGPCSGMDCAGAGGGAGAPTRCKCC